MKVNFLYDIRSNKYMLRVSVYTAGFEMLGFDASTPEKNIRSEWNLRRWSVRAIKRGRRYLRIALVERDEKELSYKTVKRFYEWCK